MKFALERTPRHDRLYVLAQTVGWGGFTLAYVGLAQLIRPFTLNDLCLFVATNAIGLLLAHAYRVHVHRRGWRGLGLGALFPRVLAATLVLSILWTAASWPIYHYLALRPPPEKLSIAALLIYSLFNGCWIYLLWSLLYFGYHAFDTVRRTEVERWRLQSTVNEAELRALKSQVNPHFIFNSLNTVRALIDEDPARARSAVTQLAHLLRYSLQTGQQESVPFEDELSVVNDYLALEQVRHEERLRLRLDVAPETLAISVPPMLLQTLVENAVKYGIAARPEGGEIAIVARCLGDTLVLQVFNPGDLSARPPVRAPSSGGSTGVGLHNAAERLRLLSGGRARLELRQHDARHVVAEAVVPIDEATSARLRAARHAAPAPGAGSTASHLHPATP